jgi:hypothetical protein
MFGLLTQRPGEPAGREDFRKNYCGTCKVIGTMYGQKERLLLNYDVVFLSELLAAIHNRPADFEAISVYRCFSLPRNREQIPAFLAYTASINLLLSGIKISDNIQDSGYKSFVWRVLARVQKRPFTKARSYLEQSGLKMTLVDTHVAEQAKREKERKHFSDLITNCSFYAEMTGGLSGEIFRVAANTVGKPELAGHLFKIGRAYGEIVYLTDALNDYEKDLKQGTFNPLLTGQGSHPPKLPQDKEDIVYKQIMANMLSLHANLYQLPVTMEKLHSFKLRIEGSIQNAVFKKSVCSSKSCQEKSLTLYQKYQLKYARAKAVFTPSNQHPFMLGLNRLAAGLMAVVLLFLPFNLMASSSTPPPQSECWQSCFEDCAAECCICCCGAFCDSICNSSR